MNRFQYFCIRINIYAGFSEVAVCYFNERLFAHIFNMLQQLCVVFKIQFGKRYDFIIDRSAFQFYCLTVLYGEISF